MSSAIHRNSIWRILRYILLTFIIFFGFCQAAYKIFIGEEIGQRLRIHDGPIVSESDSLFFNNTNLVRNKDYRIDYINGMIQLLPDSFDKKSSGGKDSLVIYFTPLPSWLKSHYGIELQSPSAAKPQPIPVESSTIEPRRLSGSTLSIKGAKKFSIISQTSGTSQFNQSLELTVSGEVSPGVLVAGSVSDRGYNPAYGTVNSRISELDRIFLNIKSNNFQVDIGNLELSQKSDYKHGVVKQVNGLSASFDNNVFSSSLLLARPRGSYRTFKFNGLDLVQGPYKVFSESNNVGAIVPGSERVWLDGRLLERGADKDYIMDYPSSAITFTPNNPIDSRSRIEIDYEILNFDYQKGLYHVGGGIRSADSAVYFKADYTVEKDDMEKLRIGELQAADRVRLQAIGDSTNNNFRDGYLSDSLGDYIERFDTLGERYFEYVGDSLGDYRVNFTAVPPGKGDYRFEGNNIYRYTGRNKGDYLPIVVIPVPEYESFFETELGLIPGRNTFVGLVMRQSNFDRNVASSLHDYNNTGGQYRLTTQVGEVPGIGSKGYGLQLTADIINKNFKPRSRRNRPDLNRRYLIPAGLQPAGDEREVTATAAVVMPGPYSLYVSSGLFNYENSFNSIHGSWTAYPNSEFSFLPDISYTRLTAELDSLGRELNGENEIFSIGSRTRLWRDLNLAGRFKFDRRWNQYNFKLQGTTEKEYDIEIRYKAISLAARKYIEDTLVIIWQEFLTRDRVVLRFDKTSGTLRGNISITAQELTQDGLSDSQLLTRLNMSYNPRRGNFSIGGSYSLSDENRFERGIQYVEVEPGQGRYIFEDGQYIPDPQGNYIQVEEIHSLQSPVKRGEKTFNMYYAPRDFYMRLVSNISEELLAEGGRDLLWLLPFFSDNNQPYLFRKRYHAADLKLWNLGGYYFVNLGASGDFEDRRIVETAVNKSETALKLAFNEPYRTWRFIQEGTYFESRQDVYYYSAGDINGFMLSSSTIKTVAFGQLRAGGDYRYAEDAAGSYSRQYRLSLGGRLRLIENDDSSLKIELYRQNLGGNSVSSYRLTDNRSGTRGIIWSVRSDYNIGGGLRFSISFNGQHADDKKPRIFGRGEFVASF